MAKAKKPAADKPAAARRKAPPKAAKAPAAGGTPLVDTNLAAQAAARMLLGKAKLGQAAAELAATEKESGTFKQLKESLNKPAVTLGDAHPDLAATPRGHSVLDRINQPQHGQTKSGFNRTGVPRRTAG